MDATSVDEALKGKQANIDKNNNGKIDAQDFKLLKSKNEATKVIVHGDEAQDKKLVKKMMNTEEAVEEATLSAKAGRAGKDLGAAGKNFSKIASSAAKRYGSEEAGKNVAGAILAKMRAKANEEVQVEEIEQFDETVLVHATYEIKESYSFGEYLTTAKNLVGDEEAINLANEAFKAQDTSIFAEELGSMDVMARINSHRKAGHTVTEPKYSTKAGKPYHEYVVTDKETGTRRKYIHHGSVSKVENMGAKPKKDEQ